MKVKVCGMKYPENIVKLAKCQPDLTGLIFYERSKRYVGDVLTHEKLEECRSGHSFVGVFVNASEANVSTIAEEYGLKWVQLHGDESPEMCAQLRASGLNVIKAIGLKSKTDLDVCEHYRGAVDFFLFDTRTEQRGGSGRKFDWEIIMNYDLGVPFFLSGGIGPEDVNALRKFGHEMLYGIDLNSRFEIEPGLKDIELIASFMNKIRQGDGRQ